MRVSDVVDYLLHSVDFAHPIAILDHVPVACTCAQEQELFLIGRDGFIKLIQLFMGFKSVP